MRKSEAIQQLERLDAATKKAKYPNVPEQWLVKTKYNPAKANGLTKCIIDWLAFNGHHAERISVVSRQVNRKFVTSAMQKGTADVSATIFGGKSLKVEVKIGKDRQSEAQKKYQQQVESSGGLYFIAKDFDSFFEFYNQIKKCYGANATL